MKFVWFLLLLNLRVEKLEDRVKKSCCVVGVNGNILLFFLFLFFVDEFLLNMFDINGRKNLLFEKLIILLR